MRQSCRWKQPLEKNLETGKYRFECDRCGKVRNHHLLNYNSACEVLTINGVDTKQIMPTVLVEMKLNSSSPPVYKPIDGTDLSSVNIPEQQNPAYLPFETPAHQRGGRTPIVGSAEPIKVEEPVQPEDGPSLLQKAANFTKAITRHVVGGMNLCTEEQIQKRAEICFGCSYFRRNPDGESGVCSHLGCGCNINLRKVMLNKLAMPTEKCPVDKWGPEQPTDGV